jgi:hypothetical protein
LSLSSLLKYLFIQQNHPWAEKHKNEVCNQIYVPDTLDFTFRRVMKSDSPYQNKK